MLTDGVKLIRVRIKPISRKMRNKVREHGDIWYADKLSDVGVVSLTTLNGVHNGGRYPYSVWVAIGKDIEILEEFI